MEGTKHLKREDKISVMPDLPPVLRPLKKDLLAVKRDLPVDLRKKARIKYLKKWPYLQLTVPGRDPAYPKQTAKEVVADYLEHDPAMSFTVS